MPLETIPCSAVPSRTNELSLYTPSRNTTVAGGPRGSGPNQGPIPTSSQTMAHGNSNAHRFSEFYTSQHYQADLLKFKEDLANAIKNGSVGSMPLQFLEIGSHVENHAIEWYDFQHDTQFHGVVVA